MEITLQKRLRGGKESFQLDVAFQPPSGEILAIMGPSGAGKTTILKMIAGLLSPEQGSITIREQLWYDSRRQVNVRPQQRSIGYVFQEYALFPNMSVRENLRYALPPKHSTVVIDEILELMHLQNLQFQKPTTLSGGQQQRVALARAIVRRPLVLLLDEPFAALDAHMRMKLQDDLLEIHRHYQTTTLLVSHDPDEVARMADQVIVLSNGKIEKQGPPEVVLALTAQKGYWAKVIAVEGGKVTIRCDHREYLEQISDPTYPWQVGDNMYITPGEPTFPQQKNFSNKNK